MPCIESKGITGYYIDFSKPENAEMRQKTIAFNRGYYMEKMNPFQRINIKTAYGFNSGKLFEELHLLNTEFFKAESNSPGQFNTFEGEFKRRYLAKRGINFHY